MLIFFYGKKSSFRIKGRAHEILIELLLAAVLPYRNFPLLEYPVCPRRDQPGVEVDDPVAAAAEGAPSQTERKSHIIVLRIRILPRLFFSYILFVFKDGFRVARRLQVDHGAAAQGVHARVGP